jgi:hypothetical protein
MCPILKPILSAYDSVDRHQVFGKVGEGLVEALPRIFLTGDAQDIEFNRRGQ